MKTQGARRKLRIAAPAKVNFFFELFGKRADGFHEIETVMSTVSLFDFLEFVPRDDSKISISVSHTLSLDSETSCEIPANENNLVYRALKAVKDFVAKSETVNVDAIGADIILEKRIPSEAGLGGASSDAAATIVAANAIWQLQLSDFEMREIAATIGSDVPFFLSGGFATCRGRGELIEPFACPNSLHLLIAKPPVGLSTGAVYQKSVVPESPNTAASLVDALSTGNAREVGNRLFNRLEFVSSELTDEIGEMKKLFDGLDCLGHQMSGSGSSYFGVFNNFVGAQRAAKILSGRRPDLKVFCCRTLSMDPGAGSTSTDCEQEAHDTKQTER